MATIERRTSKDGHLVSRAKVRWKGHPPQTATFTKRSDALKWIQITEAAILAGRHFKTAEAKRHTIADLIDRYTREMLSRKHPSTAYSHYCHRHKTAMRRFSKDGRSWFSHKTADGRWCKGQ